MAVEAFGIEKEFLKDLLREVKEGQAQLPEFQRSWVWPDRNISSLLASISLGYPVGTVMMLRAGGDVKFRQRPVQGATPPTGVPVDRLILDGQQRLTSLFQAIALKQVVETQDVRKQKTSGWFYLDMVACLDPHADREEAVRFIPADRIVRNFRGEVEEDLSTPEREYAAMMFPVSHVFDWPQWQIEFQKHWNYEAGKIQLWTRFYLEVVQRFEQYQVPVIELGKQTPREAVCAVFEKVNTGGVTLTVFELLTATFAAGEFDLRADWEHRRQQWSGAAYRVLREVSNTDFLQAVTLLATRERRESFLVSPLADDERAPRIGCKRGDMLALRLGEHEKWAPVVVDALKRAAKFLHQEYVYDTKFLPYGTQVIPLVAILASLGKDAEPQAAQQKIARWYWCGVFGELYGGTTETRFSRDLPDVVSWVRTGAPEPRTVTEASFSASRLLTLRTRGSAAYKGLYALLMHEGGIDWRTGEPGTLMNYFDDAIDIHHIFPKAWCEKQKIPDRVYNSIVNKTPLSARTNRVIGGFAPSVYLSRLASSAGLSADDIDRNVQTHLADPALMRKDAFEAFFEARSQALQQRVARAMGKPLDVVSVSVEEVTLDQEDDEDGDFLPPEEESNGSPASDSTSDGNLASLTDPPDVSAAFASSMKDIYLKAKDEAGYTATYFLSMLSQLGPLKTARQLINSAKPSDGFTALWERGRLDLTVEAVALRPEFAQLFSAEELKTARRRLLEYGWSND